MNHCLITKRRDGTRVFRCMGCDGCDHNLLMFHSTDECPFLVYGTQCGSKDAQRQAAFRQRDKGAIIEPTHDDVQ